MLRPLLAFLSLAIAAFLLAPTVASVHDGVESFNIKRDLPWRIFTWRDEPTPPGWVPPDCDRGVFQTQSEVTQWPERLRKNETFAVGGHVIVPQLGGRGVPNVRVELFLNETKEEPGIPLGVTTTQGDGSFLLQTKVPFNVDASRYHLVAHAFEKIEGCKTYKEHWSDPEMTIISRTRVVMDLPEHVIIGRELDVRGTVLDEVGAPVRGATLNVTVDGERFEVQTDTSGAFVAKKRANHTGEMKVVANFTGNEYYTGSELKGSVPVLPEFVELENATNSTPLALVRGQTRVAVGHVYLAPDVEMLPVTIRFAPMPVSICPGCPAVAETKVQPDKNGNFTLNLTAPSSGPGGDLVITIAGGALKDEYDFPGVVRIPVTIDLAASGTGFFERRFAGNATARDETGAPVPGDLTVQGPGGYLALRHENGSALFESEAPCGVHRLQAVHNGTGAYQPASKETDVGVCGFLAFIPAWMLGMPWWAWAGLALGALLAWIFGRRAFDRYAPSITRGPLLTLTFSDPRDGAPDVASPGERVRLTAILEAPLPEGLRLRMGTIRDMREEVVGADLQAHMDIVPEALGDVALRAEILDARGRVLTRRTATLRVVRYAEEIERRYRSLKRDSVGATSDVVTPREFEAWLRAQAPDIDPRVAQRLVDVFEEADYSPREAGRNEFVAYLRAEGGLRKGVRNGAA